MDNWLQLRPTPEQYCNFAEYLCEAHSWYKHLPLLEGRRFVVFVSSDAGYGRLVAVLHGESLESHKGYSLVTPPEGSEFTDAHPRLHYGWKTTKEYRAHFGYLDYSCWQTSDGSYDRDAGLNVRLPATLVQQCEFVLYPFVSQTFAESITWNIHDEELAELRAGMHHPAREQVLQLAQLVESRESSWTTLTEAEQEWVVKRDISEVVEPWPSDLSQGVQSYLGLDEQITAISNSLYEHEISKIHRALAALDAWLLSSNAGIASNTSAPTATE